MQLGTDTPLSPPRCELECARPLAGATEWGHSRVSVRYPARIAPARR